MTTETALAPAASTPKRRGRPPGSKNQPRVAAATGAEAPKRRGRPPGSKNAPKAAKGGGGAMMDALLAFMRAKPAAVFADARDAMAKAGHKLFPISWGRAQMLLGRVKAKPRGQGKAAMAKKTAMPAGVGAPVKRGPGRPPKAAAAAGNAPTRAVSASSGASIAVAAADLMGVQAFVDAINRGGALELRYATGGWTLSVAS